MSTGLLGTGSSALLAFHELLAGPSGLGSAGTVFITSQMVAGGASPGEHFGRVLG